jgi:hypothetical protein
MQKESKEKNSWKDFLKSLSGIDSDFVLIGGAALNLHGIPRMTIDIDIMIPLYGDNVSRLVDYLKKAGLCLDDEDFIPLLGRPDLLYGQCISFSIPGGSQIVDVFLEKPADFKILLKSSETMEFDGFSLRVATLKDIRKMKLEVGRAIDRADVALIDEFLELAAGDSAKENGAEK